MSINNNVNTSNNMYNDNNNNQEEANMNIIRIYHGTNSRANAEAIMDNPIATNAINGFGFYASRDINVARNYGQHVVCWEIDSAAFSAIRGTTQGPIDRRYTDPSMDISYGECAEGGMEVVFTQRGAIEVVVECEDSYIV